MIVEFSIPMKCFSVNQMSSRDQRFKTKEFKDWHLEISTRLSDVKELQDVADMYKAHGGAFLIWIEVVYPHHIFFNKSKQISAKTIDVSNFEKPLIDVLFRDTLGVNDLNIVQCVSSKRAGASWYIDIKLELDTNYYA